MKNHTETTPFDEQKVKFTIRRVKAIRNRVCKLYRSKGYDLDFHDDEMIFRILAVMWLDCCEKSNEKTANMFIEMSTVLYAESLLAGLVYQA